MSANPSSTHKLLALAIALALVPLAHAQDAGTQKKDKQAVELKAVVVTGTRTFDRTEATSMSPIDVLTPKDLVGTGATNLASREARSLLKTHRILTRRNRSHSVNSSQH